MKNTASLRCSICTYFDDDAYGVHRQVGNAFIVYDGIGADRNRRCSRRITGQNADILSKVGRWHEQGVLIEKRATLSYRRPNSQRSQHFDAICNLFYSTIQSMTFALPFVSPRMSPLRCTDWSMAILRNYPFLHSKRTTVELRAGTHLHW